MRRDMTTSLRACLAAEAWKRLYPEETRGGNAKSKVKKLPFEDFAKQSFKVGERYAKQALAIANHRRGGAAGRAHRLESRHCGKFTTMWTRNP
jgi:hypothetical protein